MEPFPVTLNPHQALTTELLALIPDHHDRPADNENLPQLYEFTTREGRLALHRLDIPPTWWADDGPTGVLDALTARITANPWRYTDLLGYALHHPDKHRAWAADRAGTVLSAAYDLVDENDRPRVTRTTNPARLVPEARALRRAALAINGPALPTPRAPTNPPSGPDEHAAACVLIEAPDDLAAALTDIANDAGITLHHHRAATMDVGTWRNAQLLLVLATPGALHLAVRMPHRPGLVLLDPDRTANAPNPGLARDARALGAEHVTAWPQGTRWLHSRITAAAQAARDATRSHP